MNDLYCGDGVCSGMETLTSCYSDCRPRQYNPNNGNGGGPSPDGPVGPEIPEPPPIPTPLGSY